MLIAAQQCNSATVQQCNSAKMAEHDALLASGDTPEHAGLTSARRRWLTIEPIVFLHGCSITSLLPLIEQYLYCSLILRPDVPHGVNLSSSVHVDSLSATNSYGQCSLANQSDAAASSAIASSALLVAAMTVASGIPAVVVILFLGSFIDQAGRKYGLIPSLAGGLVRAISLLLIVIFAFNPWIIVPISFLEGLTGGFFAVLMTCYAYLSDVSTAQRRSLRFGVLAFFLTLSAVFSQLVVGYLLTLENGFVWASVTSGLFELAALMWAFVIPETVQAQPNFRFFTLLHYKRTIRLFLSHEVVSGGRFVVFFSLAALSLVLFVETGFLETLTLFLINEPFHFGSVAIGVYFASYALVTAVGSLFIILVVGRCRWCSDVGLAAFGCATGAVSFCALALSNTLHSTALLYAVPALSLALPVVVSMIRSRLTKLTSKDQQGALSGGLSVLQQLVTMVSGFGSNLIFTETLAISGGALYFLDSLLLLLALAATCCLMRCLQKEKQRENSQERKLLA